MARVTGGGARRARVGRGQRWTAAERARYLAEFGRSGLSAAAFVRRTGVPHSTFDLWLREGRQRRGRAKRRAAPVVPAGFARVEILPPAAAPGLRLVVRTGGETTAELTGVDGPTAVAVVQAVLRGRSR